MSTMVDLHQTQTMSSGADLQNSELDLPKTPTTPTTPTPNPPPDSQHIQTRQRLLEAAAQVFSEKGYHDATFREICRRAQTNNAAINYHFRDKQQLYLAVIEEGMRNLSPDMLPLLQGDLIDPPENQLHLLIRTILNCLLTPRAEFRLHKIVAFEMANPSPVIRQMVEKVVLPTYRRFCEVVRALLGESPESRRVRNCALSIMGQCVDYHHSGQIIFHLMPYKAYDEAVIEQIANHITEFSLGALRSMKTARGIEP